MAWSWCGRNDFLPQIALEWDSMPVTDVFSVRKVTQPLHDWTLFSWQPFLIDVRWPAFWHLRTPPCALFWCTMLCSRAAIFHPYYFISICLVHSMAHMIKPLKLMLCLQRAYASHAKHMTETRCTQLKWHVFLAYHHYQTPYLISKETSITLCKTSKIPGNISACWKPPISTLTFNQPFVTTMPSYEFLTQTNDHVELKFNFCTFFPNCTTSTRYLSWAQSDTDTFLPDHCMC